MRNIKLVLEYDGTDFCGSQLQPGVRTVQGELEKAVARLTGLPKGERCVVHLAGRTDTGVHASGQVASFKTESPHSLETFGRGLTAILPFDLAVLDATEMDENFHARFSATERHYRYTLLNRLRRSPIYRRFAHTVTGTLDVEMMRQATVKLLGRHDFSSFAGSTTNQQTTTVRTILGANWQHSGDWLVLEIAANAFLPHMVRNIVGTLLLVGKGELIPANIEEILAACDRRKAGPTAPACGLSLVEVRY